MTQKEPETKLPPTDELEEQEMAVIPCAGCGIEHTLQNQLERSKFGTSQHSEDEIRGTIICGANVSTGNTCSEFRRCDYETFSVIKVDAATFLPGKLFREDIGNVHENARKMINEAVKCFYGGSFTGVVAMCSSAVVEQILGKDVGSRKDMMPTLLEKAKAVGLVTSTDETHVETARLVARDALHYMDDVTEEDAILALRSAVGVINDMSEREPKPA